MVSLKKYLVYSFIFVVFLFLSSISFALEISDSIVGYTKFECLRNCTNGTCELMESGKYLCRMDFGGELLEDCTSGEVQYKPSGTCGTSSRTCCSDKSWSGWDTACPKTCDGVKPVSSQTCTASNGKSGTQTRTVTCDTSTGEWTTGSWGTCTAPDCSSGETKTCPSNSKQVLTCTSAGKWSTSCTCPNGDGDGKVYCQGMTITTSQASTCYHGIWSRETCSGICCCSQDTPKLMSNGYPGCWGTRTTNKITTTGWQYSCQCAHSSGGGGGLIVDPGY